MPLLQMFLSHGAMKQTRKCSWWLIDCVVSVFKTLFNALHVSFMSPVAASNLESLPPKVLLTITKLQCMLESKQERIAALERQVEDLMPFKRKRVQSFSATNKSSQINTTLAFCLCLEDYQMTPFWMTKINK